MRHLLPIASAGIALLVGVFLIFVRTDRREATFFPMGPIPVKVVAFDRTIFQFHRDVETVRSRVDELARIFNRHDPGSELAELNREASTKSVPACPEMRELLELSREWRRKTGGAFDPTVGPLVDVWSEAGEAHELPTAAKLAEVRGRVGLPFVESSADGKIRFSRKGMSLDFGAIAKGAIVDEAAAVLLIRGVRRGLVEAGGDGVAFGPGTFQFGIQDPVAKAGAGIIGTIEAEAGAVVTSGSYERFIEIAGKRFSHIIDPRTGRPAENGIVSATVVGGAAADADALATALMVLPLSESIGLLKEQGAFQALLIRKGDGGAMEIRMSEALSPKVYLERRWAASVQTF